MYCKYSSSLLTENVFLRLNMSKVRSFECIICQKTFNQRQSLHRHKKTCSEKDKNSIQCINCQKVFYRKDSLKRHTLTCRGKSEDPVCTVCKKKFKTNWHLRRHVQQVHVKSKKVSMTKFSKKSTMASSYSPTHEFQSLVDLSLVLGNLNQDDQNYDDFVPSMAITDRSIGMEISLIWIFFGTFSSCQS